MEYQGGGQRAVGSAADADQCADRRLHHGAARPHEQQDRGNDDAAGDDVALGALAAVEWLRRRCHMNSPTLAGLIRSEEHTSELQSLMRNSYAVFCLKKKIQIIIYTTSQYNNTPLFTNNTHRETQL